MKFVKFGCAHINADTIGSIKREDWYSVAAQTILVTLTVKSSTGHILHEVVYHTQIVAEAAEKALLDALKDEIVCEQPPASPTLDATDAARYRYMRNGAYMPEEEQHWNRISTNSRGLYVGEDLDRRVDEARFREVPNA